MNPNDIAQYESIQPVAHVEVRGRKMAYGVPNRMALWRVQTLHEKEPATIAWLDAMTEGSAFLDIGANIGLYTVYAAVQRGCRVVAFEPEAQNYAQLNRNIFFNKLHDRVTAYCAALSDEMKLDRLYLSKFDYHGSGSCHSFGAEVGFDLAPRASPFVQGSVSVTLDWAVAAGMIEVPDYIKIDVDGFEHKVIAGARELLRNPKVRELLIEVNPHIESHRLLLDELAALGFHFDPAQRSASARTEGAFSGVGEIIFRRAAPDLLRVRHEFTPVFDAASAAAGGDAGERVLDHILRRVADTPIDLTPFPHMVIDDFFPPDYYAAILEHFPADGALMPLNETGRTTGTAYQERLVALFNNEHFARLEPADRQFWVGFAEWLYSERFINGFVARFFPHVAGRLAGLARGGEAAVHGDALIVSDKTNYAIGPHTDAAHRLITFLMYLPADASQRDVGTSFYRPLDPAFECQGGPHYGFDKFERLSTVEFLPNRAVVFVRGNQSFHGVEPIAREDVVRHLLINNIRLMG